MNLDNFMICLKENSWINLTFHICLSKFILPDLTHREKDNKEKRVLFQYRPYFHQELKTRSILLGSDGNPKN